MPQYAQGIAWTDTNLDRLRERFTGTDLQTQELRDVLWPTAERLFKPQRDSMENDLRATAWVAGAMKRLTETLEGSPEGMIAIFEVAMEMGHIFSAESGKHEALEILKAKPAAWWRKKAGGLSPNDIMKPVYMNWWRTVGNPEERRSTTKWEALKHAFGSREMWALAELKQAVQVGADNDRYVFYDVDGEEVGFNIMAKDAVHPGGQISQHAGAIIG